MSKYLMGVIATVVVLVYSQVYALTVSGYISDIDWLDETQTQGTAHYTFSTHDAQAGEQTIFFKLKFHPDAFVNTDKLTPIDIPTGWNGEFDDLDVKYKGVLNGNTTFSFSVNFILKDSPDWGALGAWEQIFSYNYLVNGELDGDSGVCGMVPEPASLLLMGTGIVGVGFFRKKRKITS